MTMSHPFGAACFTGVAIALTVALPQAPGFVGVFHVAMQKTMILWGQGDADANGFAIVFWAVSFSLSPPLVFGACTVKESRFGKSENSLLLLTLPTKQKTTGRNPTRHPTRKARLHNLSCWWHVFFIQHPTSLGHATAEGLPSCRNPLPREPHTGRVR